MAWSEDETKLLGSAVAAVLSAVQAWKVVWSRIETIKWFRERDGQISRGVLWAYHYPQWAYLVFLSLVPLQFLWSMYLFLAQRAGYEQWAVAAMLTWFLIGVLSYTNLFSWIVVAISKLTPRWRDSTFELTTRRLAIPTETVGAFVLQCNTPRLRSIGDVGAQLCPT